MGSHFVHRGVAHIVDGIVVFTLEELHFERQDAEQLVHIAPDGVDTVLLPCPYLGSDVVIDGDPRVRLHVAGNLEVEAGIVHQNHHIGLPVEDVPLALAHLAQYRAGMQEDGPDAHVSHVAIVAHQLSPLRLHHVAAITAEDSLGIALPQGCNEMAGVQVATGFAGNEIVFHEKMRCLMVNVNDECQRAERTTPRNALTGDSGSCPAGWVSQRLCHAARPSSRYPQLRAPGW